MRDKLQHIKSLWSNNSKVAENYLFMTSLQVAVILINLLLYPYLIRTLGKESYGTYIFILANVQLFVLFFASGFSFPAIKKISLNADKLQIKNQTISEVFTAKFILFGFCAVALAVCIFFVPFVRENMLIYILIFATSALGDTLFPLWYFQGMQKMSFVTYVNLAWRIASIPLIFIFVKSPVDLLVYVIIASVLPFCGNLFSFFYLRMKEKINVKFVAVKTLKPVFKDTVPFYWTSAFSRLKNEGVQFIIGIFWGMNNVAIYDLAHKIISIAGIFTNSINTAVFPKAIQNLSPKKIKQIFRYETIIGLTVTALIILFGYWAVLLLGGKEMLTAYPLTIILSFTIYFSLMVGCYVNYIFVPQNHYYFVSKNQLVSFVSFCVFTLIGFAFYVNIITLVVAITLSQFFEMLYCNYLTRKHKLMSSE